MKGLFPNALHVARREYLIRIRSRSFVVVTVAMALVGMALALAPVGLRLIGGDRPTRVAIFSEVSGLSTDALEAELEGGLSGPEPNGSAQRFKLAAVDGLDAGRAKVRAGGADGLLSVSRNAAGDLAFSYFGDAGPLDQGVATMRQAASAVSISDRMERAGIQAADRAHLFAPTAFDVTATSPGAARQNAEGFGGRTLLAYVMVILTFMAIITYGNWVAGSVAEEKSSRVMELLITAATPRQLLFGKILGAGAAGLSQFAALLGAALIGILLNGPIGHALLGDTAGSFDLPGLTPSLLVIFGFFFLTGFILYATLYAAAGSMVSRQEEVQQSAAPMMVLVMVGYFASFAALNAVDAGWVAILSFIPFFSPYLMPMRIVFGVAAWWEVAIAAVLLLVFIAGAVWLAARIYSAGVLLYGQRLGLREVLKAARVSR